MVQPGEAILNAIDDFENNRQRIIRETVAVKQHEMMTNLQTETIKKMDEDAMNLPAGQFNAEKYLEDFNTKSANLLNQFEDKQNRLRFQDMTTQIRGQLGLKANRYELQSLKEAQRIATENVYSTGVQNIYKTYQDGGDVKAEIPIFFTQADALKPSLSFSQQQELEERKGDYAVLTMNLQADQLGRQLLEHKLTPDEYMVNITESQRFINDFPLNADQRVKVNDIFSSEIARTIESTMIEDKKQTIRDFDGYKLELIRTGKINQKYLNKLTKYNEQDSRFTGLILELEAVKSSRPFYSAMQRGDVEAMRNELIKAQREADPALSQGEELFRRNQRFQKLNVDYEKAKLKQISDFADFYKDNPRVKFLKMQGNSNQYKSMVPYVSHLSSLAVQQGLDFDEITILDKDYKQNFREKFEKAGRNVDDIRALTTSIDYKYGEFANKVFEEIIGDTKDPKLNALRYRNDESFGKIWQAVTMSQDEMAGRAQSFKIGGLDLKEAAEKLIIGQQLKPYYDTRIAQNDINIGSRIMADTDLGYRLRLLDVTHKDVGRILANKNFSYIKNNSMNVRIPVERDTPSLRNKLNTPNLVKKLVRSKVNDIDLTNLPFTEMEQKKIYNQEPKAAIGIATSVIGLASPAAAVGFAKGARELSKQIPKKSFADLKNKIIEDALADNAVLVSDEQGFKIMVKSQFETETLQMVPLKDTNKQIIRFTYDEIEMLPEDNVPQVISPYNPKGNKK